MDNTAFKRWLRAAWFTALVALGVLLGPARALGDDAARELIQRGKLALREKRGGDAREAFEKGLKVGGTAAERWQMQLGLALAFVLEERFTDAAYAYRDFLRTSAGHAAAQNATWQLRRSRAREDLLSLEKALLTRLARLHVQSEPPGAQVSIDGLGDGWVTPAVIYVEPGQHRIAMHLVGHETESLSLTVETGEQPLVHRKLVRPTPWVEPARSPREPRSTRIVKELPPPTPRSLIVPGALTLATGAAFAVAGGAVHWTALRDAEEVRGLQGAVGSEDNVARDRALRERIDSYQTAYVTLYIAGGAGMLASAAMLIVGAVSDTPSHSPVAGWVGADGAGIHITGTW